MHGKIEQTVGRDVFWISKKRGGNRDEMGDGGGSEIRERWSLGFYKKRALVLLRPCSNERTDGHTVRVLKNASYFSFPSYCCYGDFFLRASRR